MLVGTKGYERFERWRQNLRSLATGDDWHVFEYDDNGFHMTVRFSLLFCTMGRQATRGMDEGLFGFG